MAKNVKQLTADEIQVVLNQVDDFLDNIKKQWDDTNNSPRTWWRVNTIHLMNGTQFIINSLDHMIQWVEDLLPAGKDKKATVTLMAAKLFDYIVVQAFPIWLKPFAPAIKTIIINIVISSIVDFIVDKYKNGIWNTTNAETVEKV